MRLLTLLAACVLPAAAAANDAVTYIVCEGPGYHVGVPVHACEAAEDPTCWPEISVFYVEQDRWVEAGFQPFGDLNPAAWEHFTSGKAECRIVMHD